MTVSITRHLQQYLDQHIPITQEIGIRVVRFDAKGLVLTAPLFANKNDKHTAFGGSLAAVIILSGWALTHLTLEDVGIRAHTVVRRSKIDYLRPVKQDIYAICSLPSPEIVTQFKQTFLEKGKARWELHARVETEHELAVDFSGVYVAIKE
jgi:thioesterase domain-containing protein